MEKIDEAIRNEKNLNIKKDLKESNKKIQQNKNDPNFRKIHDKYSQNSPIGDNSLNKKGYKNIENKKGKRIHYKGTMNNTRGIPPLPNWSNRFSSTIIQNNLLYLSNNYIVNIDLTNKQFIQLIHSSLNIYFENKFSVICKIKDLSNKGNEESHMFITVDSSGNVCFFNKIKEIDQNQERSNFTIRAFDQEKASNQSVCFREERYISKIGRSVNIKTILNVNLKNVYKDNFFFCYEKEHAIRDLNIILFGDNDGNINIFEYFYNEKEKEIQMNKKNFSSIKISKGVCTDMVFLPQKNIFIFSTSSGFIEFYSILRRTHLKDNEKFPKNKNDLLILTHQYDSKFSFIFSLDYFLSNNLEQINLSVIDKNGSFELKSLYFKDLLLINGNNSNLQILLPDKNNEKQYDLKEKLKDFNFNFNFHDKNRFNNKKIQDQYLFFSHKIIFKENNEKYFEIFFTSNKGKIYYTSINLNDYLLCHQNDLEMKLTYQEIPENPHNKNIFAIANFNENKLLFISADGVISLLDHYSKFFEMDVKTIRFRPSAFVDNFNKNKNLFFYDEGNNLLKYNHDKQNNGLQSIVRNPLKLNNSDKKYFKKNEDTGKKEIKDYLKIKICMQANFNENIFALLEYNYILKTYSISVYDFGSDTRIYRRDLLFKIKLMQFAFERKFQDLHELIQNRDDLKKSETKQISKIDDILSDINIKECSETNIEDQKMDCEVGNQELELSNNKEENLEDFIQFDNEDQNKSCNNYLINNYNLGLNENDTCQEINQSSHVEELKDKEFHKNKLTKSQDCIKFKSKKLFDDFDEKKYMFTEKFKQIIQQIFNENNYYQLLHLIDEDNNYIVIDFLKNKFNTRKLNNFTFNEFKLKDNFNKKNSFGNLYKINEDQSKFKDNNVNEKTLKSKQKFKKTLMVPLVLSKSKFKNESIGNESSEDLIIIILEEIFLKIGIINQMEDFYIAKINIIENNIVYKNPLNFENCDLEDEEKLSKRFMSSIIENQSIKFCIELIRNHSYSNDFEIQKSRLINLMFISLENEKNLRIFKIHNSLLELLMKYNILENIDNYSKRNFEITNLLKEACCSNVKNKNESSFNSEKIDTIDNKILISQLFFKNFSNVPAIHLKAIFNENNSGNNKSKINIITSLIDNSLKYFEIFYDSNNLLEFKDSNLTLKYSINAHIAKIQDILFISETNIASLSNDQSLKIWDINKCKLIDLPILNSNTNQKTSSSKFNQEIEKIKNKNEMSIDYNCDKKNVSKIFPIFTKIVNDAIYSQSYTSCNDFVINFTNFYKKHKQKKEELNKSNECDNISKLDLIRNSYIEFLPILIQSYDCLFDKKYLDYLIFTFSEINWINKKIVYCLIKYELGKNNIDNWKINSKNLQTLFCLVFYLFIFNFKENLEDIYQIILKTKIKIQTANSELENQQKLNGENNLVSQNENSPKFYSNLKKIELIIIFFDKESEMTQNDNNNGEQTRNKNLIDLNKILFTDIPLRAKFFEFLIYKNYDEAEIMLEENDLFFESMLLIKLVNAEEPFNFSETKCNYLKFKEKLNKFRAFIYSKQIYQAQKCQAVINVLNDIYN